MSDDAAKRVMTRTTRLAAEREGEISESTDQAAKLDALIEDATVDAYDESEQRVRFLHDARRPSGDPLHHQSPGHGL